MDADVALEAASIIHDSKLPLSDLSVHVVLQDGVLTLDPLKFGMAGGSMAATARLDGSGAPLSGRIEVHARRLRLKQLFPASPSMQKTLGELHGDLALTGSGNSVAALLGSATGDVKMLVNDGVISRSLMEIAGLNVGNYVVSKLFGDDEVKINCGVADLQMKSGTMTPRVFVFDTENALIGITGTADFKNETEPGYHARQQGLPSLFPAIPAIRAGHVRQAGRGREGLAAGGARRHGGAGRAADAGRGPAGLDRSQRRRGQFLRRAAQTGESASAAGKGK